jgi:hypothetical protein
MSVDLTDAQMDLYSYRKTQQDKIADGCVFDFPPEIPTDDWTFEKIESNTRLVMHIMEPLYSRLQREVAWINAPLNKVRLERVFGLLDQLIHLQNAVRSVQEQLDRVILDLEAGTIDIEYKDYFLKLMRKSLDTLVKVLPLHSVDPQTSVDIRGGELPEKIRYLAEHHCYEQLRDFLAIISETRDALSPPRA